MNTDRIISLLKAGQLAVEARLAAFRAKEAKYNYYAKIREYEDEIGYIEGKLNASAPQHADAREFTGEAFADYKDAKRAEKNIRARLETACRRAGA